MYISWCFEAVNLPFLASIQLLLSLCPLVIFSSDSRCVSEKHSFIKKKCYLFIFCKVTITDVISDIQHIEYFRCRINSHPFNRFKKECCEIGFLDCDEQIFVGRTTASFFDAMLLCPPLRRLCSRIVPSF